MKILESFVNFWIICVILIMPFVLLWKVDKVQSELKEIKIEKPNIVNEKTSNLKIVGKSQSRKRYTVTVEGYGTFLVTKEQYERLKIGDDIPEYLKKRGS